MPHRYTVGQMLELRSAPRHSNRKAGLCQVIGRLPNDKGPVLYRVKSINENVERVVEETDLTPSVETTSTIGANSSLADAESVFNIAISKR